MHTPAPSRAARLALVGVAVVVLLAIVAVASRGGFGHTAAPTASSSYTSWAMSVFLVLFFAAVPFTAYVFVMQQRESLATARRKSFSRRTIEALVAFAFVCLFFYLRWRFHIADFLFARTGRPHGLTPFEHTTLPPGSGRHAATQPHFEWPVLWVMLALAVVAVVLLVRRRRQLAQAAAAHRPTVAEELAATIDDAIDDLEAEPDPRRAVIAAYARMEAVLARHGVARRPSQTPLEYLRRVLADLSGRGADVERLTGLYEEAKFSTHQVDGSMKRDAITALQAIRTGLSPA